MGPGKASGSRETPVARDPGRTVPAPPCPGALLVETSVVTARPADATNGSGRHVLVKQICA